MRSTTMSKSSATFSTPLSAEPCGGDRKCLHATRAAVAPTSKRSFTDGSVRPAIGPHENAEPGEEVMSCLEMPGQPAPDFLDAQQRAFNDPKTMQPRAPGAVPADARNGARVKTQDVRPEGLYRPNHNFLTPNMR